MTWNSKRARKFMQTEAHNRAQHAGLSDTALRRLSALSDPTAAETEKAFTDALLRAGWSDRRIDRALATVKRPSFTNRVLDVVQQRWRQGSWFVALTLGITGITWVPAWFLLLFDVVGTFGIVNVKHRRRPPSD